MSNPNVLLALLASMVAIKQGGTLHSLRSFPSVYRVRNRPLEEVDTGAHLNTNREEMRRRKRRKGRKGGRGGRRGGTGS